MNLLRLALGLGWAIASGCAEHREPVGLGDWAAVIHATEDFLFRGDSAPVLRHSEPAGSLEERRKVERAMRRVAARGVPKGFNLDHVEVLTPEDFAPGRGAPPGIARELGAIRWSRPPQKIVVYHFVDAQGGPARFYFGAFQENGLWFFAVRYFE